MHIWVFSVRLVLQSFMPEKKTRNHRHTVSFYEFLLVRNIIIKCRSRPIGRQPKPAFYHGTLAPSHPMFQGYE